MSARIGHGVVVTLLLVGGCGSGDYGSSNQGGVTTGSAGWIGGASGSAGGEPAASGATGSGTAGSGTAGDGSYGSGTAGSGGTTGGATSSAGAGGGSAAGGAGGASAAGGATGGGGVAGNSWLTPPPVPPALEPPEGAAVKLHAHAVGAQIYTCTASGGASADGGTNGDAGAPTYAWVLKAPDAKLYDSSDTQVGTHGAGPSWTWRDGSVANGAKVTGLDAPSAGAI